MDQLIEFFLKIFDTKSWPARWHCGLWTDFHGWMYIVGDLLVWSSYFAIPLVIFKFIVKKKTVGFFKLYFLFALFILACGFTHLLSAISFWYPLYRLSALALIITGVISWLTVVSLIKFLPALFSLRSKEDFEKEIESRKVAEEKLRVLNYTLDTKITENLSEIKDYKYALDQASIVAITDENGLINFVNENYCKISQYTEAELIGSHITKELEEKNSRAYIHKIFEKISTGETWRGDLAHVSKDQKIFWTASTIVPFTNKNGNAYRYLFILFDITERMNAEKAVEEKSKLIDDILERITDGFISLDNDFNYNYVNKKTGEMVGRSPESLIGKNVWEVFPDARDSITFKSFKRAVSEQKYLTSIDYYEPLDLWQENHIYPTENGLFVFIRDITKQKRAEIAIKNSEKRFRKLIENNEDIIALIDKESNPIYRSPSAEKLTGMSNEHRKKGNAIGDVHAEDQKSLSEHFQKALNHPHVAVPVQFRTRHKEGHYIWLEGSFTNMLEEESIQAILVNLRDVTAKKLVEDQLLKSERIYKNIASNIPGSVICLMDLNLKYQLIEGDMLERLGYSKNMLLGNYLKDVIPKQRYEELKDVFENVLKGEIIIQESVRNGVDLLTRFVPLKDENGNVYMVMTVAIDITQLKLAQKEVAELNYSLEAKIMQRTEQLQIANGELESFSYSVSHDLRAPLRSINGYSKMLEEDYSSILDADGLRILRTIQNNARRMGMLIDDLLSFSRLGRLEVKRALVNMDILVRSLVPELMEHNYQNAKVNIGELHAAFADISLIKQVFINFISNALKYSSRKNNPEVNISSTINGSQIVYAIKDNGTGFNMDYIHKLFNVFQRLHSVAEFEGTGVGLAIVKRIVEKHGGKVWAESKEGEGATFYFSLPNMD